MGTLTDRTVQVGPFDTHVITGGPREAPPLLLLHDGAWGADASNAWGAVAPLLVNDFRLIMPDLLGFGRSAKVNFFDRSPYAFRITHLAALLENMGEQRPVHVIGSSFGGSIALRAAISEELPIASATSIAGTGGPWRREDGKLLLGNLEPGRDYISRIVHAMANTTEGLEMHIDDRLEASLRPGHYAALSSLRLAHPDAPPPPPDDYPASLSRARCPVTIVDMSEDVLNEEGWVEHVRSAAPRVRIVAEPGPHCLNLTDPARTAALIRELIATIEA
jgi:pimeloyl-ACP methyl ester carboxylesterase